MIFDSPELESLRKKFLGIPPYEIPEIVFLDSCDEYENERVLLENIISSVSPQKQKEWFGRLVNCEVDQHIGTWFEMMLYSWLKENFKVQVEPEIEGCFPDFVIDGYAEPIAVEAKAYLLPPHERARHVNQNRIYSVLSEIQRPFNINMSTNNLGTQINVKKLVQSINIWLDSEEPKFIYDDVDGNILEFTKRGSSKLGHLCLMGYSTLLPIDPFVLKPALKKKSSQHKALRDKGIPYIIALYPESRRLRSEKVVEAWLGKIQVLVDRETGRIEERTDRNGASFFDGEVVNKSVSGILAFNAKQNLENKSRELEGWYIQNPFAENPIATDIFPVKSRYLVVEQHDTVYKMAWV